VALAVKPYIIFQLTLVMFLHYLTLHKNRNSIDELKQRLIDTWDRMSQRIIDKASGIHCCIHV